MSHRVLFLMSGSIAAYKACHVISRLMQRGHELEIVASPWALEFVGEATLEGLTGRPVHQSMFGSGAHMSHIHLVRWADLVIVCPATANTINKLANGIGDDLMTTLFLAHDFSKPWLIAPAMNTKMYHHPVTRESVQRLSQMGCRILETASGVLACGEIGDGKLLDPELLLESIESELKNLAKLKTPATAPKPTAEADPSGKNQASTPSLVVPKVLITAGGTEEPIDQVRAITNTSTGQTGRDLADVFSGLGYDVTLLKARSALGPKQSRPGVQVQEFRSFHDLKVKLEAELQKQSFEVVIHAAAVSDYHVESVGDVQPGSSSIGKFDSKQEEVTLKLRKNPKLLDSLRKWSKNPNISTVAFKFTAGDGSEQAAQDRLARLAKIADSGAADLLVSNDLTTYPDWELHRINDGKTELLETGRDRHHLGFAIEAALKTMIRKAK